MIKFFHHQPPAYAQIVHQELYEAQVDLLKAESELESAQSRAEGLRKRVARLSAQDAAFKESSGVTVLKQAGHKA